jgi:hypothetical protein
MTISEEEFDDMLNGFTLHAPIQALPEIMTRLMMVEARLDFIRANMPQILAKIRMKDEEEVQRFMDNDYDNSIRERLVAWIAKWGQVKTDGGDQSLSPS